MMLKKQLPNFVTLLNLFSGCIAVVYAMQSQFALAAIFVCVGIFFDFFDGLLARKLNAQSKFGIQLDSLADLVTSGLVPGIVMYKLISNYTTVNVEIVSLWSSLSNNQEQGIKLIALVGFLIPLASAYRLARFNLDEDQQQFFKGLPTPANALFIVALPLIIEYQSGSAVSAALQNASLLIAVVFLSCWMLVSTLKLFSLKLNANDKLKVVKIGFLVMALILVLVLKFIAIPVIILIYILISLLFRTKI